MNDNSNLAARLKKQIRQEQETIQSLTQTQLNTLQTELNNTLQYELNTIKNDIRNQSASIGWNAIRNRVIWPTLIGLSLCVGLFGGSWTTMRYFTKQIIDAQEAVTMLEKQGSKIKMTYCGDKRRLCALVDKKAGVFGEKGQYMILEGY